MRGLLLDYAGVLDRPGPLPALVAQLRARGVRTAIVSNMSGGIAATPVRALRDTLVDAVVLSGDVGVAKPDPRLFRHAARVLGVAERECVFVDDLWSNIRGAVAVGMVGVHHVDGDVTVAELRILFDADGPPARNRQGERESGDGTWTPG